MKLRFVSLTGADNTVKPEDLANLSKKYPFVEWAILFSQSKSGTSPRYPSLDWVRELVAVAKTTKMNLAAHLCGKWVDDVMRGNFSFLKDEEISSVFQRIQLNLGKDRLQTAVKSPQFLQTIRSMDENETVILGGNIQYIKVDAPFFLDHGLLPLFDASGGRGILDSKWPSPFVHNNEVLFCGYAGGLGPDNVAKEIENIASVVDVAVAGKDPIIWIDMESKLRSGSKIKDSFDLEKCEAVLQLASKWVESV